MTKAFASIGVDIGKEVFHLVGFDNEGAVVLRRKIKRSALVREFEKLPPTIVGMEACLSAHFVSRTLRKLGHEPRTIPAIYVKPFMKGQKNDYHDAEAIAEAALRPNIRLVAEKTQDQLDLQALHRVRVSDELYKSLTWDRGKELADHRRFTMETNIAVNFCDPQSPWRRGSNENTNLLLRQYFPRQSDLAPHSQAYLNRIARQLNERPPKTPGLRNPGGAI